MSGAGPDIVRIKRKRDGTAPDALLVEHPGKRHHTRDVHYVLKRDNTSAAQGRLFNTANTAAQGEPSPPKSSHVASSGSAAAASIKERRVFHLKRPTTLEGGVKKRKAKDRQDGIATFVEHGGKRNAQDWSELAEKQNTDGASSPAVEQLKRPGRGSAVRRGGHVSGMPQVGGIGAAAESDMLAVADTLNRFAVEEAAKEQLPPKPKVTAQPKLPPQRSRELHQRRIADQAAFHQIDMEVDDDGDYVYDTYVLAPLPEAGVAQIDSQDSGGNVGYLVITDEDQAVWETYIEDEPSDKDWNSDEDDENAEDWYGADYPDDEVASDDEHGHNAYGYRAHGSDDEEWDADTGNYSDDEYERQMNPWHKKTPDKFSKYLTGTAECGDEED